MIMELEYLSYEKRLRELELLSLEEEKAWEESHQCLQIYEGRMQG